MKISHALFVLACLSVLHPARGQEVASATPAVALVCSSPSKIDPVFYAWGGEPLSLLVTTQAPLGTRLRIYADVSQQTSGAAAPWLRDVPVSGEIIFNDRTSVPIPCRLPALRAVQRKTRVTITLHSEPKSAEPTGGLVVRGFVYPREEPDDWKKRFAALLARSGCRRVAIFGDWKNAATFLHTRKVEFDDLGADWPAEADPHTLYFGGVSLHPNDGDLLTIPPAFTDTPGLRLVLFAPLDADPLPPGVYQTVSAAGGTIWKVTLPDLFAKAATDDPHGLETLGNVLQQVLAPRPTASEDRPEPTPTP